MTTGIVFQLLMVGNEDHAWPMLGGNHIVGPRFLSYPQRLICYQNQFTRIEFSICSESPLLDIMILDVAQGLASTNIWRQAKAKTTT
jgi:hypothetical protein